jgi:hypothetical protein
LKCSAEFLLDAIANRVIEVVPGAARASVRRGDVEKLLGRPLTLEDLQNAWRAGDSRRQANKKYYIAKGLRLRGPRLASGTPR